MTTATTPAFAAILTVGQNGTATGNGHAKNGKSGGNPIADLRAIFAHLRDCKERGDFDAYQEACMTAGVDGSNGTESEAAFYWKRHNPRRSGKPIENVQSNAELAESEGMACNNEDTARCSLLYRVAAAYYPDLLEADIIHGPHVGGTKARTAVGARRVTLYQGGGRRASWTGHFYRLFQGVTVSDLMREQVADRCRPLTAALGDDLGLELGRVLFELRMLIPDPKMSALLAKVIRRGLDGQEVILVGAFCPDYAYEETGDPNLPYRYTFDGLGTGVGLVAQQFGRVTPTLSRFMTARGIKHRIVLGIGDFEADSADVLRRVGCDYAEFVARCAASLEAFRTTMPADIPVELELCDANRCKGRLRPYAAEATAQMKRGDYGLMPRLHGDPNALVKGIVRDNGTFYRRWYSPTLGDDEIRDLVLGQGGEYSALSRIYAEDFGENVVVISGDRPQMHAFDTLWVEQPILCVKRAY